MNTFCWDIKIPETGAYFTKVYFGIAFVKIFQTGENGQHIRKKIGFNCYPTLKPIFSCQNVHWGVVICTNLKYWTSFGEIIQNKLKNGIFYTSLGKISKFGPEDAEYDFKLYKNCVCWYKIIEFGQAVGAGLVGNKWD